MLGDSVNQARTVDDAMTADLGAVISLETNIVHGSKAELTLG